MPMSLVPRSCYIEAIGELFLISTLFPVLLFPFGARGCIVLINGFACHLSRAAVAGHMSHPMAPSRSWAQMLTQWDVACNIWMCICGNITGPQPITSCLTSIAACGHALSRSWQASGGPTAWHRFLMHAICVQWPLLYALSRSWALFLNP